ncbi:hypothetical protein [Larkinella terrae]|uniref:Late embryogenesis abundant protein LEA-2 subgroup domain-containing protein n=1 Tax=Larkinella terrae TaxID=2025311 RepID=A0A7K0EUJ4_9BACT|nr:hypothetical protein [Larkinella terrae]MRS65485.1 hypothetical protein [Larkinella terrae]
MRKLLFFLAISALALIFTQCSVNRQISQAKALGDCKFHITSADSVYLSGIDVRKLKNLEDLNPMKYPQLATGFMTKSIPISARLNIDITNPTNKTAAIDQLEYKILLAEQELFNGFVNQRIEVAPGGASRVPVKLNANAYKLMTDDKTRDAFTDLVRNMSGSNNSKSSRLTIKIKPTLALGNKKVDYPGYITIDQEVTSKMFLGQ